MALLRCMPGADTGDDICMFLYTKKAPYAAAKPVIANTTGLYRVSDDAGVVSIAVFVAARRKLRYLCTLMQRNESLLPCGDILRAGAMKMTQRTFLMYLLHAVLPSARLFRV